MVSCSRSRTVRLRLEVGFNVAYHGQLPITGALRAPQALLDAGQDGIIDEISQPYFDDSHCVKVQDYEVVDASEQNVTLVDVGGVFLILGMFVVLSFLLWLFRRSPPAKKQWKRYSKAREKRRRSSIKVIGEGRLRAGSSIEQHHSSHCL